MAGGKIPIFNRGYIFIVKRSIFIAILPKGNPWKSRWISNNMHLVAWWLKAGMLRTWWANFTFIQHGHDRFTRKWERNTSPKVDRIFWFHFWLFLCLSKPDSQKHIWNTSTKTLLQHLAFQPMFFFSFIDSLVDLRPYRGAHKLTWTRLNRPRWPVSGSMVWHATWGFQKLGKQHCLKGKNSRFPAVLTCFTLFKHMNFPSI